MAQVRVGAAYTDLLIVGEVPVEETPNVVEHVPSRGGLGQHHHATLHVPSEQNLNERSTGSIAHAV